MSCYKLFDDCISEFDRFFNGGVNRLMSLSFLCDVWEKGRDGNNPTEGPIESEKSFFCTLEVR